MQQHLCAAVETDVCVCMTPCLGHHLFCCAASFKARLLLTDLVQAHMMPLLPLAVCWLAGDQPNQARHDGSLSVNLQLCCL